MVPTQNTSPAATVNDPTIRIHGPRTTRNCLAGDTVLMHAASAWPITLRDLVDQKDGAILTMREASLLSPQRPFAYLVHQPAQLYRLTTYTGRSIEATAEQPFLTRDGWKPLSALGPSAAVAVVAVETTMSAPVYDLSIEGSHNFVANDFVVHNSAWCSQALCKGR